MSFDPGQHPNYRVGRSSGIGFLVAPLLPYVLGALLVTTDDRIYLGMEQGQIARTYLLVGSVFGILAFSAAKLSYGARERRASRIYKSVAWALLVAGLGGFYVAAHLMVGGSCDAFSCG